MTNKLVVDPSGNVGIGTDSPSCKLDVEGDVQAHSYHTGDLYFQKDGKTLWRMFEDEEGLYVQNVKNGETFNLNAIQAMQKQIEAQQGLILSIAEKVQALEKRMK